MGFKRGKGNLGSINQGDQRKANERRSKSTKGYYSMAFTEPFERLTTRDIDIRQEYAKDAVARFYGIHKNYVKLRNKSTKPSGINLDEVFYIYVGQHPVGKLSIRVTRFSEKNNRMLLIYQHKNSVPKRHVQSKFKPIRTATEQRRHEKKRQRRSSSKGKYRSTR